LFPKYLSVPSCAFAAYFPPEHGDQFAAVHKVFGASKVSKLLAEVAPADRVDAVESLVYEARARLRDATLRFAKEQDERMRAVRVAVEAKRKHVAWKDAVKRGQAQPLLNRQMAEAQQAAAAAQSAREQAMQIQQAAAVTGQGIPDGHPRPQMADAQKSAAADQVATEQHMLMLLGRPRTSNWLARWTSPGSRT
ncbi:hypothetical protein EJB05_14979, partial [Eragrostis curvula]